jgi:hypothetical protein
MAYQNRFWNLYKSEGEKRIGNYLEEMQISFSYEKPVAVVDSDKTKVWYPDFYLDDYHLIIEYFGMKGVSDYERMNKYKRKCYNENRLDVIEIYPLDFKHNWKDKINYTIQRTLESRTKNFEAKLQKYSIEGKKDRKYEQISFLSDIN